MQFFVIFFVLISALYGEEDHATISCYAIDTQTGKTLLDNQGNKTLIPASCMKLVSTMAALEILGPDMRFETAIAYEGGLEDGILKGNLVIIGGGDPCLGSNRIASSLDWKEQLAAWCLAIKKIGIRKIQGTVIGDASRWEQAMAVPSWQWEDLGNYYGAGASALSFHENAYSAAFRPTQELAGPATLLSIEPPLISVLKNEVKTGAPGSGDQVCIYGSEFSSIQWARGSIPMGVESFIIRGAIPDPGNTCAKLLSDCLLDTGIEIGKEPIETQARTIIHTTYSPPLSEIVYWTNQKSINLYAEHLLKKMGEVIYQEGSTSSGIRAVKAFWEKQGVDLEGFVMADASGLSRKNAISAKQLTQMLRKAKEKPWFPIFFTSLPKQKNGSHAKTGAMSQVHGLAGFLRDTAFTILTNHTNVAKIQEIFDQFYASATSARSERSDP